MIMVNVSKPARAPILNVFFIKHLYWVQSAPNVIPPATKIATKALKFILGVWIHFKVPLNFIWACAILTSNTYSSNCFSPSLKSYCLKSEADYMFIKESFLNLTSHMGRYLVSKSQSLNCELSSYFCLIFTKVNLRRISENFTIFYWIKETKTHSSSNGLLG